MEREATAVVTAADSATLVTPFVPDVYASARMIAFVEDACARLLAEHLCTAVEMASLILPSPTPLAASPLLGIFPIFLRRRSLRGTPMNDNLIDALSTTAH